MTSLLEPNHPRNLKQLQRHVRDPVAAGQHIRLAEGEDGGVTAVGGAS